MPAVGSDYSRAADPLLIGGTGRCGTTILGTLLGQHPEYAELGPECMFHAHPRRGLPALLRGKQTLDDFLDRMRGLWWDRSIAGEPAKRSGLHVHVSPARYEALLSEFERALADDAPAAACSLIRNLLDPVARRRGASAWIDTTPTNADAASFLLTLLPRLKIVNVVRDGRDVAASVAEQPWGPASAAEGIRWWERRLRDAHMGTRGVPADRVLTIHLEELCIDAREPVYRDLLAFAGIDDTRPVRAFFESQVTADRCRAGRWRTLPDAAAVDELYHDACLRLSQEPAPILPATPRQDQVPAFGRGVPAVAPIS